MTQNINYSSVYSAGLKLAGFHLPSCQSTCPRHPTEMSRQHQPGDRVLLVRSQPWRNLGSICLTGGERWRSGFDAQVFLKCWSNGGVGSNQLFRALKRKEKKDLGRVQVD